MLADGSAVVLGTERVESPVQSDPGVPSDVLFLLPGRRHSRLALCLWLPTFELRLELVRSPELDTTSVALLAPAEGTRQEIWQVSERAAQAGVQPGMGVSQAVGLCPSLTLLEADPAHYDAAQEAMLEVLSGYTPVVEPAGRGRVFLGMDGLERLYGSPRRQAERALASLLEVLPRPLVAATRAGWAPGKFGAWVAAVAARPGEPVIVKEEALGSFLASQPVAALPVSPAVIERLERLGIETLGGVEDLAGLGGLGGLEGLEGLRERTKGLASLPEPALVAQFGDEGRQAVAWATGRRIDPVRPWHRPQPIRVSLDFPVPIGQNDTLQGALDRLLERALSRPARRGRSIRGVRLQAGLEGGGSWGVEVVLREPTAERERIAFALRARLAFSPPPRAVETLTVELYDFGSASRQADLFGRREEGSREEAGRDLVDGEVPSALREAVLELKLKFGHSPLYRVVEVDPWSRIPERRDALLNFDP